jgi:hypothetical protein
MRLLPRHDPLMLGGRLALAALAGLLLGALLARGAVSVVLALVPPGQPLVRAVVGGLAALLSVTLGFGLTGALSARGLPLVRLGLTRRRACWSCRSRLWSVWRGFIRGAGRWQAHSAACNWPC